MKIQIIDHKNKKATQFVTDNDLDMLAAEAQNYEVRWVYGNELDQEAKVQEKKMRVKEY